MHFSSTDSDLSPMVIAVQWVIALLLLQLAQIVGLATPLAIMIFNILLHKNFISYKFIMARDEPTRTCCGPPSWAPKIKTLEKIKNIDLNFENQD